MPVAALVALAEGGYGVQVVEGGDHPRTSRSRPACSPTAGSRSPATASPRARPSGCRHDRAWSRWTAVTQGRTPAASTALRDVVAAHRARRAGRDRRAVRLRQVDHAAPDRHAGPADRGHRRASTGTTSRRCPTGSCPRCGPAGSASSSSSSTWPPGVTALDNVADGLLYAGVPRGRRRRARRGRAGPGRARAPARPPAARAVRRRAAAGRDRPGGRRRARRCCSPTSRPATSTRPPARRCWTLLRELHAAGTTVVVITHDREIAGGAAPAGRDARRPDRLHDAAAADGPARLRLADVLRVGGAGLRTRPLRVVPVRAGHRDRHRRDDRGRRHLRVQPGRARPHARPRSAPTCSPSGPGRQLFGDDDATLPDESVAMIGRIGPVTVGHRDRRGAGRPGLPHRPDPGGGDRRHRGARGPPRPARHGRAPTVAAGTWLNAATARYPAVVLGSAAAERLGVGSAGPNQVWLGGEWFTVVGILEPVPLAPELDSAALVGWPARAESYLDFDGHPTDRLHPGATRRRSRRCRRCSPRRPTRRRRTRSRCPGRPTRWPPGRPPTTRSPGCCSGSARWRCSSAGSAWPTRW